ncbi:MAG: DUF1837 domain-containing protein [Elusimicrobiota bacterium]
MTDSKTLVKTLSGHVEVSRAQYDACLDVIEHKLAISGVAAEMRFHHLRFDSNGIPKFDDLAQCIANYVVEYCFSARRRGSAKKPYEHARLMRDARALFTKKTKSGESGEMLLYFLLEAVLGAPQIVAKYELKTHGKMEVHGSDGIHMKWNEADKLLDIYFGESKLEKTIYNALDHAFKSMENFHEDGMRDHEFGLVTSHFKLADEKLRKAVEGYLDRLKPGPDCRVNHALLIGFDWDEYGKLKGEKLDDIIAEFRRRYAEEASRFKDLLQARFDGFKRKTLRFEIFFLPFKSVQDFRDAFIKAL